MTQTPLTKTPRTTIKRAPERACYDRALLNSIIDEAIIGHLSFYMNNSVHSIPMPFWHHTDYLYCHAAVNGRLATMAKAKQEICVSFSIIDGFVLAKSTFRHSMNYRSIVLYGRPQLVTTDLEKNQALEKFMTLFNNQRWGPARIPNQKELNATALIKIPIKEAVIKQRRGPPDDKHSDLDRDVWSGVIPYHHKIGKPQPDQYSKGNIGVMQTTGELK